MSEHTKKEWEVAEEIYGCWHSGYECLAVDALANYTSTLKAQRDELLAAAKNILEAIEYCGWSNMNPEKVVTILAFAIANAEKTS